MIWIIAYFVIGFLIASVFVAYRPGRSENNCFFVLIFFSWPVLIILAWVALMEHLGRKFFE